MVVYVLRPSTATAMSAPPCGYSFYSALRAMWSTKEPSSLAPPHIDLQVLKGLAQTLQVQPFSMIVKGNACTNFIHLNRTDWSACEKLARVYEEK
jgi:hypothetical protein